MNQPHKHIHFLILTFIFLFIIYFFSSFLLQCFLSQWQIWAIRAPKNPSPSLTSLVSSLPSFFVHHSSSSPARTSSVFRLCKAVTIFNDVPVDNDIPNGAKPVLTCKDVFNFWWVSFSSLTHSLSVLRERQIWGVTFGFKCFN